MKVAVTGASGHVGNVLCRQLIAEGHQVKALYRSDKSALLDVQTEPTQGDILDPKAMELFVAGSEIVIHCAAKISIDGDRDGSVFKTNTEGVWNVLHACIKNGVKKIIHVSSTHAVEELPHGASMTEDRAYKHGPTPVYDHSKATGEQIMLEAFRSGKIQGCVVRPSSVVGPHDFKPSEFGKALLDLRNGKVPVLPPGGYDFVDVRDITQAMTNAMEHGMNGEVYFLTGQYHTIQQIAELVKQVSGGKVPSMVLPFWFMELILPLVQFWSRITGAAPVFTSESIGALKTGHPNIDNSKAQRELKLAHRPLAETIRDFYAWIDSTQ